MQIDDQCIADVVSFLEADAQSSPGLVLQAASW
jgi:hypothetical protein